MRTSAENKLSPCIMVKEAFSPMRESMFREDREPRDHLSASAEAEGALLKEHCEAAEGAL